MGTKALLENLALALIHVSWTGSTGLLGQSQLGTRERRQGVLNSNHTEAVRTTHLLYRASGRTRALGYKNTFRQGPCFVATAEKKMHVPVKGAG